MPDHSTISNRKSDHIRINLEEDVQSGISTGLEHYRFIHEALPDVNLKDIDLSQTLFGKKLVRPVLISSMTGGTNQAYEINKTLAQIAEKFGLAMGVGSQRVALESTGTQYTFQLRKIAPNALIFANLGAIQLNYGVSTEDCKKVVDMIEADALILHLNPIQEAIQPEGETNYCGLLKKIEKVCREVNVPVVIKEVGWGISGRTARRLADAGIKVIDVAGAGGTSWSQVEKFRSKDRLAAEIAGTFRGWGIPTADSILMVKQAAPEITIFASGGLRNGVDIAKCIGLGAFLGGMAGPFLRAANVSYDEGELLVNKISQELLICLFGLGMSSIHELRNTDQLMRIS